MAITRQSAMALLEAAVGNKKLTQGQLDSLMSKMEKKFMNEIGDNSISINDAGDFVKDTIRKEIDYESLVGDIGDGLEIGGISNLFDDNGVIKNKSSLDHIRKQATDKNYGDTLMSTYDIKEVASTGSTASRTKDDIRKNIEEIHRRKDIKKIRENQGFDSVTDYNEYADSFLGDEWKIKGTKDAEAEATRVQKGKDIYEHNKEVDKKREQRRIEKDPEYKKADSEARNLYNEDGTVKKKYTNRVADEEAQIRGELKRRNLDVDLTNFTDFQKQIYANPSMLVGRKEAASRFNEVMEMAEKSGFGGRFLDNTAQAAIKDTDLLYKLDLGDDSIKKIYSHANSDDFVLNTVKQNYNSGQYKKVFNFEDGKRSLNWDNLTETQQKAAIQHYKDTDLKAFNDAFSGEKTTGWGPWKKTELTGEMDLKTGRQRYIREKLGFDPSKKNYDIKSNALFTQEDGVKLVGAYRDYYQKAKSIYDAGTSTAIPNAKKYFAEELALETAQVNALTKGMGHDGIKSASRLKGLGVAAAIVGGVTALWAAGEIYDE